MRFYNKKGCKKIQRVVFFIVFITIFSLPAYALVDVGIYNDTDYQGGGAWSDGITAIKSMLDQHGYTFMDIYPSQVNTNRDLNALIKVLIVPGGWAGGYNQYVTYSGYRNIRSFVKNGGGYFGICAGAYFASDIVVWKDDWTSPAEVYDYPLDLFSGVGLGVILPIIPWNQSTGCDQGITEGAKMTSLRLNSKFFPDLNESISILYYGGPGFLINKQNSVGTNISILARYDIPGSLMHDKPAMILFNYGDGRVFLSGPHPEISFENCTLYADTVNWSLMDTVIKMLFR